MKSDLGQISYLQNHGLLDLHKNAFYIKRASSHRVSYFPESKISMLMYIVNVHQKYGHLTLVDDKCFCHFWILSRILWEAFSIYGWALKSWSSWHAAELENKFALFSMLCVVWKLLTWFSQTSLEREHSGASKFSLIIPSSFIFPSQIQTYLTPSECVSWLSDVSSRKNTQINLMQISIHSLVDPLGYWQ